MSGIGVETIIGLVISAIVVAALSVIRARSILSERDLRDRFLSWLEYEKEQEERFEDGE